MMQRLVFSSASLVLALGLAAAAVRFSDVDRSELAKLIETLDVDPGERVADIGAGDGEWSVELARVVGESGRVYATEVDTDKIDEIRDRVGREKVGNVEVVRGTQETTGLPDRCCDGILIRRVYHHFQNPRAMQESLRRALRDDGLLLIVDFGVKKSWSRPEGVPASRDGHGIGRDLLVSEMKSAGFELVRDVDWEDGDYALLFRASVPD
jgi:SAM-dependent methyltransferase